MVGSVFFHCQYKPPRSKESRLHRFDLDPKSLSREEPMRMAGPAGVLEGLWRPHRADRAPRTVGARLGTEARRLQLAQGSATGTTGQYGHVLDIPKCAAAGPSATAQDLCPVAGQKDRHPEQRVPGWPLTISFTALRGKSGPWPLCLAGWTPSYLRRASVSILQKCAEGSARRLPPR